MATPQIGDEFAGYRIEALLGRGGMGVVYRAEQQHPHRRIALKLLAPELSADANFRERFNRESDLAAAIEHPNILPIYTAGEVDGQLYIAMRYVEGSDLKELIQRQGRIDPARALSFVAQVGSALDVAHSKGLVHRDVKPQNMLIASGAGPESTDHVYLTDFGLTKHTSSRSGLTAAGHFVGTIDYVAPEQIEGKSIDPRTDIYSLGCVFFECITGRLPFERDSDVSVMYAHISDPPPSARELRSEMPPGLDAVISKALAKSTDDRFSTCREFVAAAREELGIVSGERPQAGPPGGGTVVSAAGPAGAAAGVGAGSTGAPTDGATVTDAPTPAEGALAAQGPGDPAAQGWQQPVPQPGGGWQGGQQGGWQGGQQGPGQGGWQQGPAGGPGDPAWQGPPGGGGWQGGPPGGGPGGPGWQQPPPSSGRNKALLFGIVGLVVLIAAGVGAFLFLGGDDEPEPEAEATTAAASPSPTLSPTVTTSVTPTLSPTETTSPLDDTFPAAGEEQVLYDHIPVDIQPTCRRQDPEFMPQGATVGITCAPGGPADLANYYQYPSLPALQEQYGISVQIAGARRNSGSCPFRIPAETTYTIGTGELGGRLVCYPFRGQGRIEWTNEELLVYAEAVSFSGMSRQLYNFWRNAGPNI